MYDLGEEYKKINEKIKPSDDFTKSLKSNVLRKLNEKKQNKLHCLYVMAASFILVFISGGVFAKDIGNLMSKIFSNVNKGIEVAIENNYIQNLNMDYVIDKDICIKADYILIDDSNFDIGFNIRTNIEFDGIFFDEMTITNENGDVIYDSNYENGNVFNDTELMEEFDMKDKMLSKKELIKTYILHSVIDKYEKLENININISKINVIKENKSNEIEGNWCFKIKLDKDIFYKDIIKYVVEETELLEDYNIYLTSTEMKMELKFKENPFLKDNVIKREQILIEDETGEIYYCNDYKNCTNDKLKISFPINKFENTNNLKLKIILEDNDVLIFNVKAEKY